MQKNPYSVLGISQGATKEEIDKAYKKLARKKHPDKGGSADEFAEIQAAYDILKDPQKKRVYDSGFDPNQAHGFGAGTNSGFSQDFSDFEDILSSFFGGGRRASARQSSNTYHVSPIMGTDEARTVNITLEQAFNGIENHAISYNKMTKCDTCDGAGIDRSSIQACSHCGGRGSVQFFAFIKECSACNGTGKIASRCRNCNGKRLLSKPITVRINIPAGVDNGQKLKFKSSGHDGVGAPNGNLIITVNIAQHSIFTREENDLYMKQLVNISTMVFGGKIVVEAIDKEKYELEITQNTQPETKMLVKNAGMPRYINTRAHALTRGGKGNMYVVLIPIVPNTRNMSDNELEAWKVIYKAQNNEEPKKRRFFF